MHWSEQSAPLQRSDILTLGQGTITDPGGLIWYIQGKDGGYKQSVPQRPLPSSRSWHVPILPSAIRPRKKKGGPAFRLARPRKLQRELQTGDVRCLQTLGPGGHLEFNRLAFVQRLVPFRLNGGKVNENVFAGLALDEPKALTGIKPLHDSLFFTHNFSLFFLSYLVLLEQPPAEKKGRKCELAALSTNLKGFTRATNAGTE
jgi:hypothetical protein